MKLVIRSILAGAVATALLTGTSLAQQAGEERPSAGQPRSEGSANAPDPAATETPRSPAASGGEASDATSDGSPASGRVLGAETSGSDDPASGEKAEAGEAPVRGSPTNPSNQVGQVFELPRVGPDNQVQIIAGLCGINMGGLGTEGCQCLAERSIDELSDPQRDYLIAAGMAPPVAERMVNEGRVTPEDEIAIKGFLDTTYPLCLPEGAAKPGPGAAPVPPMTPTPAPQPAPGTAGEQPTSPAPSN